MQWMFARKIMICVVAGTGCMLFAQGTRTSLDGSSQDALLAEVRALRAEIRQQAATSIRTQLLVARFQLQEQRVFAIARQLVDVQNDLATVQARINGEQTRVRQLEDAVSRAAGQERLALQQAILDAGTQIEREHTQELQLQTRETELLRTVDDAQARWTDFNVQLDTLERSMPAGASP